MLKVILAFAAGAGVGFGVSYVLLKKQYEEKANSEAEAMHEEYKKRIDELKAEKQEENEEEQKDLDGDPPRFTIPEKPDITEVAKGKMNYSKFAKERKEGKYDNKATWALAAEEDILEDEPEEDEDIPQHPTEGAREEPYSISPEQYQKENTYFEKETLLYYEEDDILATEDDEQMNMEIANTVGYDFADHFGEFGDENVCYIRNEKMGTDYEVILQHCGYYDKFISEA